FAAKSRMPLLELERMISPNVRERLDGGLDTIVVPNRAFFRSRALPVSRVGTFAKESGVAVSTDAAPDLSYGGNMATSSCFAPAFDDEHSSVVRCARRSLRPGEGAVSGAPDSTAQTPLRSSVCRPAVPAVCAPAARARRR